MLLYNAPDVSSPHRAPHTVITALLAMFPVPYFWFVFILNPLADVGNMRIFHVP